ncbi:hypothetical protein, conserved [Eimeria brunetti]|uniref:Uncharacterized protein n=1 Tax=Eimeria brunetti TaxID=51314 RepID=U6LQT8_9EIME|nr:hypothetical protein, conserved [Eimeria brunetti]
MYVKALLPQLQATLLKSLAAAAAAAAGTAAAAAAAALCRCCLGLVAALHTKGRVEALLGELALSIHPTPHTAAAAAAAGVTAISPLVALQVVEEVLANAREPIEDPVLQREIAAACWAAAAAAREQQQQTVACRVIGRLLAPAVYTPQTQQLLQEYVLDAAADFQTEARKSACLVLASLLQCGSEEQLQQYPLLQQPQQLQQLLQQLLEDRSAAVQAGALQAEQLLLQLLRSRAGSSGVTEEAANALLSDVESSSSSSSSITGRRLQQLGDYLFRVLLRVHADAAAAAAAEEEAADSGDEAAATAARDEPELIDDNWELYL